MHPRAYFVARILGLAALALLSFAAVVFIASFILFAVRQSGVGFLLGYGGQGVWTFLTVLPWWEFWASVVCLLLLALAVRRFRFGYKIPALEALLFVFGAATLTAGALAISPVHGFLLDAADHDRLPVVGPLYEGVHDSHEAQGVYRGVVSVVGTSTFTMGHNDQDRDTDDGTWVVMPPSGFDCQSLSVGERVYVAGPPQGSNIRAYGISVYPPDDH